MDYKKELNRLMENTENMALATSIKDIPNVRIVSFCYDVNRQGVAYFTTMKDNLKIQEFAQNDKVAFTTVPVDTNEHVRSGNATVQKSKLNMNELQELFIKQIPGFDEILRQVGAILDIYEIHFNDATVTLGMQDSGTVTF